MAQRRRQGLPGLLKGEDLCNLGPVALLQDLAMMALLGIKHIAYNGHHYFRGFSLWPAQWQEHVMKAHSDPYTRHPQGSACLRVPRGRISLESVNTNPLGLRPLLGAAQVSK